MTEAPAQRIDPPAIFTGFVCVVLVVLFGLFLMGLNHQKVNFNLFPSSGLGSIFNLVFLGCLGLVLFMLMKFFIDWTFIETLKYFILARKLVLIQFCLFRSLQTTPLFISKRTECDCLSSLITIYLNKSQNCSIVCVHSYSSI